MRPPDRSQRGGPTVRMLFPHGTVLAAFLAAGAAAWAQPDDPQPAPPQPAETQPTPPPDAQNLGAENNALQDEITPELDAAVSRGLAWLARQQNPDGSWGDGRWGRSVAITALACLAFMADGHLPDRGAYGENVSKGLRMILDNCAENGLIAADGASAPMYGHGFAALFLGEIYGMTGGGGDTVLSQRIHEAVVKAARLIESSQNEEGGWRYNPVPNDADTSVTICQVMALRSARNAGIDVPKEVIDRAVAYVRRCQNPDGGFKYQAMGGPSDFPRSAAGVASIQYAGFTDDPVVQRAIADGLRYMLRFRPAGRSSQRAHYFYAQYYAVQAAYLAGGSTWEQWWPAIRRELLASQERDGSWSDPSVGDHYGTAMALIVLQVPKRYLPIFQR
ncbi:MAG: terpene cyclase/mutase family protein [Phycisphaeraceae bacterium]|nr:MAG: terpene cyclase/mutase family protein [Phycisphaeraceae bacterium]